MAEARRLPAWSSWAGGKAPAGWFKTPSSPGIPEFFEENGFVVLQNGFTPAEVEDLRSEAAAICRGERGPLPGAEPHAPEESDDEVLRRYLCIHFPHKISDLMARTLSHTGLVRVLEQVIGPNVKCMQSMLFIKASGKPGQAWHQDEVYIPTRDRSLTGGWIAMDDATVENGCLWVLPGSHKRGVIYHQEWHADPRFDCSWEARRFPYSDDQAVPVEVRAGSVVFFNGYLLHRSLPNTAKSGYRRALVNHYMSAESLLPWFGANLPSDEHVAIADYRDVVLVAGEDPYAFKGIEERAGPHVRPSGEGGCGNMKYNEAALEALREERPISQGSPAG